MRTLENWQQLRRRLVFFHKVLGYYRVQLCDYSRSWIVCEVDLEPVNTVRDIIHPDVIKNNSMVNDSTYCNCNGPSEFCRFNSFSFNFCLSCRKEKK